MIPMFAQDPAGTTPPATPSVVKPKLEQRSPQISGNQEISAEEEDGSFRRDEHSFNPLQSQRDVEVGDQYFRKGTLQGAISRYRDAVLANDANAEAWLKLGIAEEKIKDNKAAVEAYVKYLELAPKAKDAARIRRRVEQLQRTKAAQARQQK
jgi:Flp pilus assembly protein TadD